MGARQVSSDKFRLGGYGISDAVFHATTSMYTAYENNGVFWYNYVGRSFGFSPNENVYLNSADTSSDSANDRMSWEIDNGSGGYRAGSYYPWYNYYKEIYKLTFPVGVQSADDVTDDELLSMGFEVCYEAEYESATSVVDLSGCSNPGSW